MTPLSLALAVVLMLAVLIAGWRAPLSGGRKLLATGCRLAAMALLVVALGGFSRRQVHEVARRVTYLVDRSASMDAAQREWIARRVASLDALRPANMERAVMAFGANAHEAPSTMTLAHPAEIHQQLDALPLDAQQTNLEAGLLSALASSASGTPGSVILFSDGRETAGSVSGVLGHLRRLGLSVFPVAVPTFGRVTTSWEQLTVPPVVQRGATVPIQLVTRNGSSRSVTGWVTVSLHGIAMARERVTIRPGWRVLNVKVPALQRGTIPLDVELSIPDEGFSDRRQAYVEVEGPPHLLMIGDRLAMVPHLAGALKRRQMDLSTARLGELPEDPTRLLEYDAVMLFNVPKSSITPAQAEALRVYLEQLGGGLLLVGLGGDVAAEVQADAPLDALLPIRFEAKGLQETQRRVCMMLLIDRSASMIGPRIAATKRAAVALVNQLSAEDLVGILAFDTQPYLVAEVQQAGHIGPWLADKLAKLRSSGGTDIYPSLVTAEERLEQTGATLKHIILLSDGNTPFQEPLYLELIARLRLQGTSISTIGIGSAFVNTEFLEWLAEATGGAYYQLRQLDELPQLVARDAERALGRLPFAEGYFQPARDPSSDWFSDVTWWPPLKGYLTATAKPGARVDLMISGGEGDPSPRAAQDSAPRAEPVGLHDPLLARWTLGQGRVVAFASDADTRWSPEWIRWPGFEAAWASVVRWVMRGRLSEELFVWVDESRDAPSLILEGALVHPRALLVPADHSSVIPVALIQTGPWRWRAPAESLPDGWYQLTVESHPEEAVVFATRWIRIGHPPASRELPGQPPQEALLRRMAQMTDGAYDEPDRAFLPPTHSVTTMEPLWRWWLPVVILLLLIDVALRGESML